MPALDVYRITDKLDDGTSEVLVKRPEARGRRPVFVEMMHQYFDTMQIDETRRVLDLECGTGPGSKTLMLVDVIFPSWMPWRRLALAEDVPGYFKIVQNLNDKYDFQHLIAAGTKADVELQLEFMRDLHAAAAKGLQTTRPGETVDPADASNPWGVFDNYIDRVVVSCVNELAPKWRSRLAA